MTKRQKAYKKYRDACKKVNAVENLIDRLCRKSNRLYAKQMKAWKKYETYIPHI